MISETHLTYKSILKVFGYNMMRTNDRLDQWFSNVFGSRHTIIDHKFSRHTHALDNNFGKTLFSIFNNISRGTPKQS